MPVTNLMPLELFQSLELEGNQNAVDQPELKVNAHIHLPPNFSAFGSVSEAVELAYSQGLTILGVSNYYDYTVYSDFTSNALHRGVFPLYGIETIGLINEYVASGVRLNDPGNPGKTYLCSKGAMYLEPLPHDALQIIEQIKARDTYRMNAMAEIMSQLFTAAGVVNSLNGEAIRAGVASRTNQPLSTVTLQERHLAQAFQEALFATSPLHEERTSLINQLFGHHSSVDCSDAAAVQNEIRSRLMKAGRPAFIADTFIDFSDAYKLTLAVGGIPAYPILADGASPICEYEQDVDALAADLARRSIYAVELIPIRNTPDVLTTYVQRLRSKGLIVTAGTEHNTPDLLPMAPACVRNTPIPPATQAVFLEGALVVAAHQYLKANGQQGYVLNDGTLPGTFTNFDERILWYRNLGYRVLLAYQRFARTCQDTKKL